MAVTVTGLNELRDRFRSLPAKVEKKVLRQSFRKAMTPVVKAAKMRAKAISSRAGHSDSPLAKSLTLQIRIKGGQVMARVGHNSNYEMEETVTSKLGITSTRRIAPWRYGHLVEFGTGLHSVGPKAAVPNAEVKAQAQPFLRPALDTQATVVMATLEEVFTARVIEILEGKE